MARALKCILGTIFSAAAFSVTQPAAAETVSLICHFPPENGYALLSLVWIDTGNGDVFRVSSPQARPGWTGAIDGGANVQDALARAGRGELNQWHGKVSVTSIEWTEDHGSPMPIEINRMTGVMRWSTPQDPTPPSSGTAQCEKGDLPFPAGKF